MSGAAGEAGAGGGRSNAGPAGATLLPRSGAARLGRAQRRGAASLRGALQLRRRPSGGLLREGADGRARGAQRLHPSAVSAGVRAPGAGLGGERGLPGGGDGRVGGPSHPTHPCSEERGAGHLCVEVLSTHRRAAGFPDFASPGPSREQLFNPRLLGHRPPPRKSIWGQAGGRNLETSAPGSLFRGPSLLTRVPAQLARAS